MAITITRVPDGFDVWGKTKVTWKDITLDTSYPSSTGYVINAADIGFKEIFGAQVVGGNQASGKLSFVFDFNATAGDAPMLARLRAFFPTGGAGTSPTTLAAPIPSGGAITVAGTATGSVAAGGTTVTSTAANGAIVSVPATGLTATQAAGSGVPGVAKEVANTGDLSTIVIRVRFEGR